jgi:hypothetical protein
MESVKTAVAPLERIVSALGGFMIFLIVVMVPAAIFGSGSFLGLGDEGACVTAPPGVLPREWAPLHPHGLLGGARATASQVQLCTFHPSHEQLLLQSATLMPGFVFFLGVLLALWLALRTARRRGLFSPHVALQVLRLGTVLFVGSLTAQAVEAWASIKLAHTMIHPAHTDFFQFFDMPWTLIIVSFATLTVGRTLAHAVRMQREIDATV